MRQEILEQLYAPFELQTRKGFGNLTFSYVASADIADRMNKVFFGSWSTKVTHQSVVEDSVLLRVEVRAWDTELNYWVSHEGFGASSYKRFAGGDNKGVIIDVGNAYKAAMSMAVRDACKRFGCGLYVEDAPVTSNSANTPNIPATTMPNVSTPPSTGKSIASPLKVSPTGPPTVASLGPPVPPSAQAAVPEKTVSNIPTFPQPNADMSTPPSVPTPPGVVGPPPVIINEEEENDPKITDIQAAALEAIITVNDLKYEEIASGALGINEDQVPLMSKLTPAQAPLVIQYGNNEAKKKKKQI